jgi:Fur family peroxide stress response transcriptional regulator
MRLYDDLKNKLIHEGLKITPQRIAVLDAVQSLNHPSADNIQEYIRQHNPGVSTGTVYNILESFAEKGLIHRVKIEKGVMRYDAVLTKHHHLYCVKCDVIKDYIDEELNALLENHFNNKRIAGFIIDDIKLQLVGRFLNNNNQS